MKRRTSGIAAASAVVIAAALLAPAGAAAASSTADPNGPAAAGRSALGLTSGTPDPLYRPRQADGFQPTGDTVPKPAAEKLGAADTKLLQQAQSAKKKTVTVLMLAHNGATDDVVAAVKKAGGTVGSVSGKVGYVRAIVPTGSVTTLAALPAVGAIDLNRTYAVPVPDVSTAGTRSETAAGPQAPGAATPVDNPYLPIDETGASAFVAGNPAWDGRGVRVGVLDTGVDVEHPALRKTSDGKPKIVDWVTETDPVTDGDGSWVRMTMTKTGPTFTSGGKTWTAPEGTFQFGLFYEGSTAGSDFAGDLNHDGDTNDSYGVLYDPATHRIWVDGNNDQNFLDDGRWRRTRCGSRSGTSAPTTRRPRRTSGSRSSSSTATTSTSPRSARATRARPRTTSRSASRSRPTPPTWPASSPVRRCSAGRCTAPRRAPRSSPPAPACGAAAAPRPR
ncbi:hypothetical protein ACQHIV_19620 [Kribbella sp. GL6]|uniref:hypothetical protein n=1 Tax=Kribbella sp. GL6 TaxID=3419765 RepID=UPI003D0203A9